MKKAVKEHGQGLHHKTDNIQTNNVEYKNKNNESGIIVVKKVNGDSLYLVKSNKKTSNHGKVWLDKEDDISLLEERRKSDKENEEEIKLISESINFNVDFHNKIKEEIAKSTFRMNNLEEVANLLENTKHLIQNDKIESSMKEMSKYSKKDREIKDSQLYNHLRKSDHKFDENKILIYLLTISTLITDKSSRKEVVVKTKNYRIIQLMKKDTKEDWEKANELIDLVNYYESKFGKNNQEINNFGSVDKTSPRNDGSDNSETKNLSNQDDL